VHIVAVSGVQYRFFGKKRELRRPVNWGLSGLLAPFPHINFALLTRWNYVFFRVLNDGFHRGKKSGLMHVVAQGGGGKRTPFCRRMVVKAFHANTHNMQESQDNAADSVGLIIRLPGLPHFCFEDSFCTDWKDRMNLNSEILSAGHIFISAYNSN
jgi:hypothetical protein